MKDLIIKTLSNEHKILLCKVDYNVEKELFSILEKNNINLSSLSQIRNKKRSIEWMTVRVAIIEFFEEAVDIKYNKERKPSLTKSGYHISISHSHERIAISLNKSLLNGIDIQHISPKVDRIKNKFLIKSELENIKENDYINLTYYWSIKEALFKVYGKNDIYLKNHIQVVQFDSTKREACGTISAPNYYKKLNLKFELIDDYTLAYIVNS